MDRAGRDAVGVPPACGGRSDEVGVIPSSAGTRRVCAPPATGC